MMKLLFAICLCACTIQHPRATYDDQDSTATVDAGPDGKVQSLCQLDRETGMCVVNVEDVPPGDVPGTSGPLISQGYDPARTYCLVSDQGQAVCCSTYTPTGLAGGCCRSTSWSLSCFPADNIYDYLHLPY